MAMYARALSHSRQTGSCSYLLYRGFFSRFKKVAAEEKPNVSVSKSKLQEANAMSTNNNMGMLNGHKTLATKHPYLPPVNIREIIKNIASKYIAEDEWDTAKLSDPMNKFKIISEIILQTNHDLPSYCLTEMKSMENVITYFETGVSTSNSYEDLASGKMGELPKNLSIQMEALRFDPETDTMFNGRTAFPGSDTVVTDIKYKRKYKDIKTTVEKPGFLNHYYGY